MYLTGCTRPYNGKRGENQGYVHFDEGRSSEVGIIVREISDKNKLCTYFVPKTEIAPYMAMIMENQHHIWGIF